MRRAKKEDQISVRLDPKLRASLEEIKEEYGYLTDSDTIRGLIQLARNKALVASEVEGRVRASLQSLVEEHVRECVNTKEYRDLVRAIVDEVLYEELEG